MRATGGFINGKPILRSYLGTYLYEEFTPNEQPPTVYTTLKDKFPFKTGLAFKYALRNRTTYTALANEQFDMITPENGCKFSKFRPSQDTWSFTEADTMFNWAVANNKKIHFHYLMSGDDNTLPQWFLDLEFVANAEAVVEAELRTFVQTVLARYTSGAYVGVINSIDFINEVLTSAGNIRDCMLKRVFGGERFIDILVEECTNGAPGIPKLLNDFDFEYNTSKVNGAIALRNRLVTRGLTFDGIGSQMHTVLRLDINGFRNRLTLIKNAGLMIHISELDVMIRSGMDGTNQGPYPFLNPELDAYKSTFYVNIYAAVHEIFPADKILAVTVWSLDDQSNFMNLQSAGMIDYPSLWYKDDNNNYFKHPAHQALMDMVLIDK